jgi:hypothetical protein
MPFDNTTNGAKLNARKNSTLLRAASGLIDRNSESANETARAASPATIMM